MAGDLTGPGRVSREVVLALPFEGRWRVENSPARRVPSHGTHLLGTTYAIDFVAVDERGRSGVRRDWRTLVATEPVERFVGFGRPVLAPAGGTVAHVHDGEADHEARRSQLALVGYALGQASRLRQGLASMAGNHVILALRPEGPYVVLAHLRAGSVRVRAGEEVSAGQPVGECGNSGNSTEPHVHVQVMDALDASVAHGVPVAFGPFREWRRGSRDPRVVEHGLPAERSVVEPV
jgi:hypothetical protein